MRARSALVLRLTRLPAPEKISGPRKNDIACEAHDLEAFLAADYDERWGVAGMSMHRGKG